LHTIGILGYPPRPVENPSFSNVVFGDITPQVATEMGLFNRLPTPEDFGIFYESHGSYTLQKWIGGEKEALKSLKTRLLCEEKAFRGGYYLPNQANPNVLRQSTSISAALRFGCLSVRKFYWKVHDLFKTVKKDTASKFPGGPHITGQLIWREYFYTMSVENLNYAKMKGNPICLDISWNEPNIQQVELWKQGKTGFPLIDAAMRQLLSEGWMHHTLRNIVAT
jgi:cryptochrome